MTEPGPPALAIPRPRGVEWLILLGYLALVARRHWICEDALITFRYSWMLAHGHGVVFNADMPPVDGYSDFLWVLIGAVFEAVNVPAWLAIDVVTVPAGLALLLLFRHVATAHLGASLDVARLGMAALATFPAVLMWSTSGLEVMPQTLCYFAAAVGLAFADDRRSLRWTALAGIGLALLRTEGALWSPVLMALGAMVRAAEGRPIHQPLLRYGLAVLAAWAAWYAWRVGYYHTWVPNTVTAKSGLSAGTLERGLRYVVYFVLLELPVLLAPLAWWAGLRALPAARVAWLALLCLGVPAWAALVGGDYMYQFRFLVPVVPFLAASAAVGWEALKAARGPVTVAITGAVVVVASWLSDPSILLVPQRVALPFCIAMGELKSYDDVRVLRGACAREGSGHGRNLRLEAYALGEFAEKGDRVVTGAVGNLGYFNPNIRLLDLCGLVTREVAIREYEVEGDRRPGHDRCTGPGFFYAQHPEVLVFTTFHNPKDPARVIARTVEQWAEKHAKKDYYPDFIRFEHPRYPGEVVYALGLRAGRGDAIEAGRRRFQEKLARLQAAVDVP